MRGLTPWQIVTAWEAGQPLDAAGRAIVMLQASIEDDVRSLTDRELAGRLVALRAATWGPAIEAHVTCARCRTALEIAVRCEEIATDPPSEFVATCEACAGTSSYPFDFRDFMWRELASAAQRLLDEVHVIASAYGWTEREILTMTSARRRQYLARLGEVDTATDTPAADVVADRAVTTPAISPVPAVKRVTTTGAAPSAFDVVEGGSVTGPVNGVAPLAAITPSRRTEETLSIGAPLAPRLAPRWAPPIDPPAARAATPTVLAGTADREVHVSIGRLEIRASQPETVRAKRPAPALEPSLGLAEYLQRREGQAR